MKINKKIFLFLGAPGSGKTTYSQTLNGFLLSLGKKSVYVNLDCSNNFLSNCNSIDFREIMFGEEILSELHIGPNCSVFFSIEYLIENIEWLESKMEILNTKNQIEYFLFDVPGQMELFTHNKALKKMVKKFKQNQFSFSTLILSDSFFWYDKTNYHILALSNLMMIFNTETAFFHILTKTDLVKNFTQNEKKKREENSKKIQNFNQNIFSWGNKLKFSIEDFIYDFGFTYPLSVDLFENSHLLNLIKKLEKLDYKI